MKELYNKNINYVIARATLDREGAIKLAESLFFELRGQMDLYEVFLSNFGFNDKMSVDLYFQIMRTRYEYIQTINEIDRLSKIIDGDNKLLSKKVENVGDLK